MVSRRRSSSRKRSGQRRTEAGKTRDFVTWSERELDKQFLPSRSPSGLPTMRPGGSILAARMFREAVGASFLPPPVRVLHILRWGYVLGMHRIAAENEKYPAQHTLPRAELKRLLKEAETLVLDSLQKAGLLTNDVRQQVAESELFSEEFLR